MNSSIMPDTDLRNSRYRNGVCTDCGEQPHSAGRIRCTDCHREHERRTG